MIPLRDDNPTLHQPIVAIVLIAINVLVFLWQSMGGDELQNQRKLFRYAAVPFNLTHSEEEAALVIQQSGRAIEIGYAAVERGTKTSRPVPGVRREIVTQSISPWLTLLTSMFMHGGWLHLLGNMWFLWIFGNNIEDATGRLRFLIFYLLCGLAAHAAHILTNAGSLTPTVGASGAISGVLGAYLLLYPRAHVLTLVPLGFYWPTVLLPAMIFLPIWFGMQLLPVLAARGGDDAVGGGVAWWAHIGGFAAGFLLVKLFETREHRERARRGAFSHDGEPWFGRYRRAPGPPDRWSGF